MKVLLVASLIAVFLVGCGVTPNNNAQTAESNERNLPVNNETQVINFVGPMDLTVELKSSDNFETAELTDNSGKIYHLKQTVSGSGVRLANDDGVSIHFKAGEGVLELVKDRPISITEYKE